MVVNNDGTHQKLIYKYLNHSPKDFPVAYDYKDNILSLPIFPELDETKIQYVVEKIKEFIN